MNKYKNELKEHELDYLYYKNYEDKNLFWFGKAGYNITKENISNEFKNSNSYFNQKLINFNNIYQNVKYEYDSLVSLDDINIEQYSKLIFISYELKYLNKLLNSYNKHISGYFKQNMFNNNPNLYNIVDKIENKMKLIRSNYIANETIDNII